jgi:hypothetical protein
MESGFSQAKVFRAHPEYKFIQEENSMRKFMRSMLPRTLLFAVCLCLLTGSARAISCPSSLSVTLSPTGADLLTSHSAGLTAATVTPGNADIVCSYTAHLLFLHYGPRVLSATTKANCVAAGDTADPATCSVCQPFAVNATIPASTPPPPTGFSPWAFGPPGTPDTHAFTPILAQLIGNPPPKSNPPSGKALISSCNVSGNGNVGFAVYSGIPAGYSCTATGTIIHCTPPPPPLCQPTLKGSKFPTANWSATSSAPGYYAYQSAILNRNNANVILSQPSLATVKNAIGTAAFNASTLTLATGGPGSDSNLPAGVISCSYDTQQFVFDSQPAMAQITVNCTNSCGSL